MNLWQVKVEWMSMYVAALAGISYLFLERGGATVCLAGTQLVWLDQYGPHSSLNERLVWA